MKRIAILSFSFSLVFILVSLSFSKDKVSNPAKTKNAWEEIFCVGGDALDSANFEVEFTPQEDIAHLTVETGASDNEKENLKRSYTAHLEKGLFIKMFRLGRVEMTMNSDKYPATAFGGETSFAALVDLARDRKGDLKGYIALEGSVYEVACPKDPQKYFAAKN